MKLKRRKEGQNDPEKVFVCVVSIVCGAFLAPILISNKG